MRRLIVETPVDRPQELIWGPVTSTFDYVIVGAGIIGLTLARAIDARSLSASVAVLDKEPDIGLHASGRNSGVLHAGFYYARDSVKARLTARGNSLLREFCHEHGVPVRACGKVVVASSPSEIDRLDTLYERGIANGVEIERVDERELSRIEPYARTVDHALWSPTTAVADPGQVIRAMRDDAVRRGIEIHPSAPVTGFLGNRVRTTRGDYSAGHVVNAAGLYADRMARPYGFCDDYVVLPFKGLYWYGNSDAPPIRRHIYPVPDPRNPFLGVHFTVTVDGRVKVGPTAIPVLWREAYSGLSGFDAEEAREVVTRFPRFLRSDHHDVPALIRSELPKYSRRRLLRQAQALAPTAQATQFTVKGKPGIRAQLLHLATGRLEMDFVVRGDENSTHVLNAVSPARTSSLAFAEHVADGMADRGAL